MKDTGEQEVFPALTPTASQSLAERQAETDSMTAYLLADLYQNAEHASSAGLAKLTARNGALVSASNDQILRSVASQSQVLEAIFHRYALLAQNPKLTPAVVEGYMRISLAAERTYLRAVAVLATIKAMGTPI